MSLWNSSLGIGSIEVVKDGVSDVLDGTGNGKFGIAISPGKGRACIALEFENRCSLNRHLHPSNSGSHPSIDSLSESKLQASGPRWSSSFEYYWLMGWV